MNIQESNTMIVGITGGIGSGKTTVANYFEKLGVPVYYADKEAKALMNRSKVIKRKLIALFGESAYKDGKLNRSFLRNQIFKNKGLLSKMNVIVHPKVASHFSRWLAKQNTPYILKEVAIIFENNLENQYDYIITVVANKQERIKRVMKRDSVSKASVLEIIENQLSDDEKIKKSHFVIRNDHLAMVELQVKEIHNRLINRL
ncbi:dephospho-CoA kinase [Winogradskyella wandonensis]|uniref:Dephospho-CoA kinase n=1 Tax=Winogradskyella wandonensis TaxID=1442586 RepID=A0A4R1KK37_9FLAO|nr:dephospho-CoA kinase [Winogradskyella wandonensis]TCK64703.1 dephospho-CoA kinase [Winogradskyella wandonensis]